MIVGTLRFAHEPSINRHLARRERKIGTPHTDIAPLARSAPRALTLIAAEAAAEDRLAPVAGRDSLAIAPDENRLHQSLMLECTGDAAGHRGACLGIAHRASAEKG